MRMRLLGLALTQYEIKMLVQRGRVHEGIAKESSVAMENGLMKGQARVTGSQREWPQKNFKIKPANTVIAHF